MCTCMVVSCEHELACIVTACALTQSITKLHLHLHNHMQIMSDAQQCAAEQGGIPVVLPADILLAFLNSKCDPPTKQPSLYNRIDDALSSTHPSIKASNLACTLHIELDAYYSSEHQPSSGSLVSPEAEKIVKEAYKKALRAGVCVVGCLSNVDGLLFSLERGSNSNCSWADLSLSSVFSLRSLPSSSFS